MPTVRLYAQAREAAGTSRDELPGSTVGEMLDAAVDRYGTAFATVVGSCQVWRNREPAGRDDLVADGDEIALLPPVSGGSS